MKKSELREMIRAIVSEELKRQLPGVVTEMYLKKLVAESSTHKDMSFEEAFETEYNKRSEIVPEPLENSDQGIYQRGGPIRRKNESKSSIRNLLLTEENPMSYLYEDVEPLKDAGHLMEDGNAMQTAPTTDVPVQLFDINKMKDIYSKTKSTSKQIMQQTDSAEERRLKQKRAELDAVIVDTSWMK